MRNQIIPDLPIWNSGKLDKFLMEDEKELLFKHLQIVKNYISKTNQDNYPGFINGFCVCCY
jgi:hypothetical protein